jgi:hypothetical protein
MARTLRNLAVFAALLVAFGAAAPVEATCLSSDGKPAVEVVGHGWKRHVYSPWLETANWYVEPVGSDVRGFQYRAVVRNDAHKTVREVEWEYRFLDAEGKLVSQHHFNSPAKIKPGKAGTLIAFSVKPPTSFISANGAGLNLVEQVSIRAVIFDDGSRQTF